MKIENKTKAAIIEKVKTFLNEFFPRNFGVLIGGSFNTEYFNDTSDIDMVILSPYSEGVFVESYFYSDLKIQAIVLSIHSLDEILYNEKVNARHPDVHARLHGDDHHCREADDGRPVVYGGITAEGFADDLGDMLATYPEEDYAEGEVSTVSLLTLERHAGDLVSGESG